MCTNRAPVRTYAELRAEGLTRRALAAAVSSGSLLHLRRGVYVDAGACRPVVSAARHGGALACVTAARHLGLWVLDATDVVHVWMHGSGHTHAHEDCACRPHWDDLPTGGFFDLPRVAVALRQILRCLGVEEFFVAVESALRKRLLTAADRAWLHGHINESGRAALAFARSDADGGLESLMRWRLRTHALAVRTQMRVVSGGRVDLLIGDRLIVEADGAPFHEGENQRHRDLRRDARAAVWGFVTLRFDYALIVHDWPTVEAAILAYVDRGLHLGR